MYLKNCEIRDRNLEVSQIHHKRKIYKAVLSTLYAFFILHGSIVERCEDSDFSKIFWCTYRDYIHFFTAAYITVYCRRLLSICTMPVCLCEVDFA